MTIAISCGEPAGIGPEIAALAWAALRHELRKRNVEVRWRLCILPQIVVLKMPEHPIGVCSATQY